MGDPVVHDVGGTTLTRLTATNLVGDAHRDLLMVARGDLTTRVLPGGTVFSNALTLAIATDVRDATAGDVDGDGIRDLIATGHFDNAVFVRRGSGNGAFAAQVSYPVRNHGHFVVVAKLNGDAFDDVIAVHDGSGQPIYVTSWLGSSTGALVTAGELATPYFTAKDVATGDFDGDGKIDLVVAMADNRASALIFRGTGSGTFEPPTTLPSLAVDPNLSDGTVSVAVGDLNGDGRDDVVLSRWDVANEVVVRLSTTSGFSAPTRLPLPSPIDVGLGDIDGDGKLDMLAANIDHGTLSLSKGDGTGRFGTAESIVAGTSPAWLAVADFNQDGLADVAVIDQADHKVRVFLSKRAS